MLASVAVRYLPDDFVKTSATGGAFTVVAWVFMLCAFAGELQSFFFNQSFSTTMMLDRRDGDKLQINFDVDLYDIECRNLQVIVFAQNSEERLSTAAQDFWLRSIDAKGRTFGMALKPNEPTDAEVRGEADHDKSMEKLIKEDGKAELDSDWADSHDGFHHSSFEHVIQAHDYTFINFFAGWCGHCRQFSPQWEALANKTNGEGDTPPQLFTDRDGVERRVRLIKVNCVDFQTICREKGVDAYPMLRLYKGDGSFSLFEGKRDEAEIVRWIERTIKMKSYGWADNHEAFERGCNAKGRLLVPRVPGRLELQAGGGDQALNPRMTNVSHLVKHLSFSDPEDGRYHRKSWAGLPPDVVRHLSPLDGKGFVTEEFHQAYIHDLKVVSTVSTRGQTSYQFHHHRRVSTVPEDEIPQAKFHFDIEPFSIWVKADSKKWYDFCTSLLAILGGAYVTMRLMAHCSLGVLAALWHLMPRSKPAAGALDDGGPHWSQ